ncbi:helix-turn-helix domain-containing protein [Lysinibacillus sp. UGB7]|uniref:helix-turn-helix domain-containing protein n=1 Tax=Lysinibacillus sp. UGB7 TaxID=3411039 RepID=UPI003B81E98D
MDYFERIQKLIDFIDKNLQEQLDITEISAKAYFSAFHFQRLFQAITAFTVQQYIRNRRLAVAARLLRETTKNILEILDYKMNIKGDSSMNRPEIVYLKTRLLLGNIRQI